MGMTHREFEEMDFEQRARKIQVMLKRRAAKNALLRDAQRELAEISGGNSNKGNNSGVGVEVMISIPKDVAVDALAATLNLIAINPGKEKHYRPAVQGLQNALGRASEHEWRETTR